MDDRVILTIDTALGVTSVGLYKQGTLFSRAQQEERAQAQMLLPLIQDLLAEGGVSFSALTDIICVRGPGSFTGLRIGLTTARTLGLALDIPVHGIATLDAAAYQAGPVQQNLLVLMETKRSDFYVAQYDAGMNYLLEPSALAAQEIAAQIQATDCALTGNAVARFRAETEGVFAACPVLPFDGIKPQTLIDMLHKKPAFIGDAAPCYLRDADVTLSNKPQRIVKGL